HDIGTLYQVRKTGGGADRHLWFSGPALLGGDEHHPIGPTGSINGSGGRILEDVNASDILGVELRHVPPDQRHSVHHNNGLVHLVQLGTSVRGGPQGVVAPYLKGGGGTGLPRSP